MSMTDPIADLLTRIRNAHLAKHDRLDVPPSKLKVEICRILKDEGFIKNFRVVEAQPATRCASSCATATDGTPAITPPRAGQSKPGRRVYRKADEIRPVLNGLGLGIVSTSQGLLTDDQARERAASAARSSARSGRRDAARCRGVGSNAAFTGPQGRQGRARRPRLHRRGPEGQGGAAAASPASTVEIDDGTVDRHARRATAGPAQAKHGLTARPARQRGQGRRPGLQRELEIVGRRLPRRGQGQRGALRARLLAPGGLRDPEGHQGRGRAKNNRITVTGADRQQVGQVAAEIRSLRKPDPYKGKGIRYTRRACCKRKVGKAGAK